MAAATSAEVAVKLDGHACLASPLWILAVTIQAWSCIQVASTFKTFIYLYIFYEAEAENFITKIK